MKNFFLISILLLHVIFFELNAAPQQSLWNDHAEAIEDDDFFNDSGDDFFDNSDDDDFFDSSADDFFDNSDDDDFFDSSADDFLKSLSDIIEEKNKTYHEKVQDKLSTAYDMTSHIEQLKDSSENCDTYTSNSIHDYYFRDSMIYKVCHAILFLEWYVTLTSLHTMENVEPALNIIRVQLNIGNH